MTENVESEQNKRLRSRFDFEKYDFYAVTHYIDAQIGFGCKKKLNPQANGYERRSMPSPAASS